MNATAVLRPVHAWFFFWERLVPSMYRVVATGLAALVTALVLAGLGLAPIVAATIALAVWIGLAIAQEHDERVCLPPDPQFAAALRTSVDQPPLRLDVEFASGPPRARQHASEDVFVLSAPNEAGHPLAKTYIEVQRSDINGTMFVLVGDGTGEHEAFLDLLDEAGKPELAARLQKAHDPTSDAAAIAEALRAAYW